MKKKTKIVESWTDNIAIWMAGDYELAKQVCREYCTEIGWCVSIEPVCYIYTGGEEAGFRIGVINYPRFPTEHGELRRKAEKLAERLMIRLCQQSYSVSCFEKTTWHSRRPEGQ